MPKASIKQIKTTTSQHEQILDIARTTNSTVSQVVNSALTIFLAYRAEITETHQEYLTSPEPGKYRSYWFDDSLLIHVKRYADIDGVSQNRIIYTSIFKFCQDRK